jgi:hypothetical protein
MLRCLRPNENNMEPGCPTTAFSWGAGRLDHWHGIQDRRGHRADGLEAVERNEMRGVHIAQSLGAVLRSVAVVWYCPDRGGSGRVSALRLSSCSTSPAWNQGGPLPSC